MNQSKQQLPIDSYLDEICLQFKKHQNLILSAAPGAGKSTRLPPALMNAFEGKIAVLEPRRLAALSCASRVAKEEKIVLGEEVGYQVRLASKLSNSTRLVFMTEALLLRKLEQDSLLSEFSIVVIDEFHERSLFTDLALAFLKELQIMGSPIKVLIMSATLDLKSLEAYLPDSITIEVPGQSYPLQIEYLNQSQKLVCNQDFYLSLQKSLQTFYEKCRGHILVFLPGVGEIQKAITQAQNWAKDKNIQLMALHGSLKLEQQEKVILNDINLKSRKVIFTTNIAETSLTVDGVDGVIDSGLQKIATYHPTSTLQNLDLTRIAQFSAIQRAGRAARQKDGHCLRLWHEKENSSFAKIQVPEIERSDLSDALYLLLTLGVKDPIKFSWFSETPKYLIKEGLETLRKLSIVDHQNSILSPFDQLKNLPVGVRLGKILLKSHSLGQEALGVLICAILESSYLSSFNRELHSDAYENDLLQALEYFQKQDHQREFRSGAYFKTTELAQYFFSTLQKRESWRCPESFDHDVIVSLLLEAFPDRIAKKREGKREGVMRSGRGLKIAESSLLRHHSFFVVIDGVDLNNKETLVTSAAAVDVELLKNRFSSQLLKRKRLHTMPDTHKIVAFEALSLDNIALEVERQVALTGEEKEKLFLEKILEDQEYWIAKNPNLKNWFLRLRFFIVQEKIIIEKEDELFIQSWQNAIYGKTSLEEVVAQELIPYFEMNMEKSILKKFHQSCPNSIQVPSGSHIKIHYPEDQTGKPFVEVRLQELFGLGESPKIMDGKCALTLHLLSPGFKPIQVTSDLESFWKGAYFEVKKELKAKYPKHSWPEDPTTATPVAKGRRH